MPQLLFPFLGLFYGIVLISPVFGIESDYSIDEAVIAFNATQSRLVFSDGFQLTANNTSKIATLDGGLLEVTGGGIRSSGVETERLTVSGDGAVGGRLTVAGVPVATQHDLQSRCVIVPRFPPFVFTEYLSWRTTANTIWNISTALAKAGFPRTMTWFTASWRPTTVSPTMRFNALRSDGSVLAANYTLGQPVGTTQELGIRLGTPVMLPGGTTALAYIYYDPASYTVYTALTPRLLILYSYCH